MYIQEFGIDPQTGWVRLVSNDEHIRYRLPLCPFCGGTQLTSYHRKIFKQWPCLECGKRLVNLAQLKASIKSTTSAVTYARCLDEVTAWRGIVPNYYLDELLESAYARLPYIRRHVDTPRQQDYCKHCQRKKDVDKNNLCEACGARHKSYRNLMARVAVLNAQDCEKLNSILDEYVVQMKQDGWCPNIPVARRQLKERMSNL